MTTPQDSTSSTSPPPEVVADLPGWTRPPTRVADPLPEGSTVTTTTTEGPPRLPNHAVGLDYELDVDGVGGPEIPSRDQAPTRTASSQASIDLAAGFFVEIIAMAVQLFGQLLHRRFTPGDNTVWLPTPQEVADISTPLSRVAARRAPIGEAVAGDIGDLIGAGVAAGGYATRSVGEQAQLRAALAGDEQWAQQHEQQEAAPVAAVVPFAPPPTSWVPPGT